jgi:hypothetical protein
MYSNCRNVCCARRDNLIVTVNFIWVPGICKRFFCLPNQFWGPFNLLLIHTLWSLSLKCEATYYPLLVPKLRMNELWTPLSTCLHGMQRNNYTILYSIYFTHQRLQIKYHYIQRSSCLEFFNDIWVKCKLHVRKWRWLTERCCLRNRLRVFKNIYKSSNITPGLRPDI